MTTLAPPPASSPPPPPSPAPVPTEIRLDILKGDRCCATCGFNLHGQTIIREPHYGMLMVRCPECGAAAALQEYPTLSRITWRIRLLMAAAWLAAMLGGLALTGVIVYAFAESTTQAVAIPYAERANASWTEWSNANLTQTQRTAWWGNMQALEQWWTSLPPDKFFADFGGWRALNWRGLLIWIYAAMALIPIGIVWSVALARLRGVRLLAVLAIPLVFTALFALEGVINVGNTWFFGAQDLVNRQIGWLPTALTMLFGTGCLIFGAFIGRPVARAFLRLVLPARLLAAFSFLWFVDGKALPGPIPPKTCALPSPNVR